MGILGSWMGIRGLRDKILGSWMGIRGLRDKILDSWMGVGVVFID